MGGMAAASGGGIIVQHFLTKDEDPSLQFDQMMAEKSGVDFFNPLGVSGTPDSLEKRLGLTCRSPYMEQHNLGIK